MHCLSMSALLNICPFSRTFLQLPYTKFFEV